MTRVNNVVAILEKILKKKANMTIKDNKFVNYNINIRYIKKLKSFKKINFNKNYLIKSLMMYKYEDI